MTRGYRHAQALGGWSSESLKPFRGGGPTRISVQMESLPTSPDLWFWAFWVPPKGVPIIPITPILT